MNNLLREGWHPKGKDGGRESWRGDFKGVNQVAGWLGKGKRDGSCPDGSNPVKATGHNSRPLPTLRDPAVFGPPPKRVLTAPPTMESHMRANGHGEIAVESENTESPPKQKPSLPPKLPARSSPTTFATDQSIANEPKPVAKPNTNSHLSANGDGENTQDSGSAQGSSEQKPSPPKLPARGNNSSRFASLAPIISSPPSYHSSVHDTKPGTEAKTNGAAADRLAKAGVSVPGLGIGQSVITSRIEWPNSVSSQHVQPNELHARSFNNKVSSTPPQASSPNSPTPSAALAENQAAFRTAQTFHQHPFSVSPNEAQFAANTVSIVDKGSRDQMLGKVRSLDQKYNVTGQVTTFLDKLASSPAPSPVLQQNSSNATVKPDISDRKPPPPPQPPKKPSGMHGRAIATVVPPPVPLGTKPSLGVVGGS